jgi:hypothetical protein
MLSTQFCGLIWKTGLIKSNQRWTFGIAERGIGLAKKELGLQKVL